MNPWPYYPPDYGDPNLQANDAYRLWLAQNRNARAIGAGLGERSITPYPWQIEQLEDEGTISEKEAKAMRREALIEKVSMAVGLIGGVMGLILSWRALRGRE